MEEARNCANDAARAVCDGIRQIGDFSYAVMPRDLAHAVGDLKKAILSSIRNVVDWEIGWIDDRVAAGDKIRDEWRERCKETTADATSQPGV
jgi:hypothetical protein